MNREFMTIEKMNEVLDEIAQSFPEEFYKGLNGGILLLPETKTHRESVANDLFVLGEYTKSGMGRYITIYYGSFRRLFPYLNESEIREKLRETLLHEFTHHLESQAGDHALEIEDEIRIREYRKMHNLE